MATKDEILASIRGIAAEEGSAPGKTRFLAVTGIRESAWRGRYWASWSQALIEAGLTTNEWQTKALTDDDLVRRLADFALELGHYPTSAERQLRRRAEPEFPSSKTFDSRLGNRQRQLRLLRDLALADVEYSPIHDMMQPLIAPDIARDTSSPQTAKPAVVGSVYLMQSGPHFRIGRSNHPGRRHYEISLQLPERLEVLHVIDTDDPEGIEAYWHRRFAQKRANGEWFRLNADDVAAFRRRATYM